MNPSLFAPGLLALLTVTVGASDGEPVSTTPSQAPGSPSAPELVRKSTLGRSRGDRPIQLLTVAADEGTALDQRPAILIVAGLHGRHRIGTDLARAQVDHLVDRFGAGDEEVVRLLRDRVLYVVPELNPDGRALDRPGNQFAIDLDRDGATDEDPLTDLDGDGSITWMRWEDPDGEWIVDPDDPRLMRKADTENGERGTHRVETEARDNDGDESRGEDGIDGRHVHRNFAHRFDEFDRNTGPFPMSEPETRALADFVFAHRNITMAFVYDVDDNLLESPKTGTPKSRTQLDGILKDDVDLYDGVGASYRELTGREGKKRDRHDGSAWSWLHFQVGIPAFATDVWRVPESSGKDQTDDEARMAHCDSIGRGFATWRPYEHPELGKLEIGGFVQGQDHLLWPEAERAAWYEAHHRFLLTNAFHGPDVQIRELTAEAMPGGAFKVEAVLVNEGDWPTRTATGRRSRRFSAPRTRLELGGSELLVGELLQKSGDLDPGETERFEWLVVGQPGQTLRFTVDSDPIGGAQMEVTLR